MLILESLTHRVLAAAFEVHRVLGPGMLESTYRTCLAHELSCRALNAEQEVPIAIDYKGIRIDTAYRCDLVVENQVLVELKAVERVLPIHEAQVITYLWHRDLPVGLLINFNVRQLKHGLRRFLRPKCANTSALGIRASPDRWQEPLA